jgi:GntR family transcriptional regulator
MNSSLVPIPRYHLLKETLRNEIKNNLYKQGELIPSEKELQERFKLSRTTIRRAIKELSDEGLLDPQPGRGTFVRKPKLSSSLRRLWGFHQEMSALGYVPSVETISAEQIAADKTIAGKFKVPEGEMVWKLIRLQKIDGQQMALLTAYHLVKHVPSLGQILTDANVSVYELLTQNGVFIAHAEESLEAITVSAKEGRILGVKSGYPALLIERLTYDRLDRIVEFSIRVCRADRYRYTSALTP